MFSGIDDVVKKYIKRVTTSNQRNEIQKFLSPFRNHIQYLNHFLLKKKWSLPYHIQLEPTAKCNCMCGTCSRKTLDSNRLSKAEIDLEKFKIIVSQIPTLKKIQLSGMGEPLLCSDLEGILKYGISKGICFTMTSNGTLLSDENIDLVLRYFKFFIISFDGGSKNTFEKTRVGASYEQVLENIKKLVIRKKETVSETEIGTNFVATHLNFSEIPMFLELCEKIGVEDVGIVEIENWLIPTQRGYQEAEQFIIEARRVKQDMRKFILGYNGKLKPAFASSEKRKHFCRWGVNSAFITVDGFVTPCCLRTNPEVINFGNVFDTSFKEIWSGEKFNKFRKTKICNLPNPVCDNCPD